MQLIKPHIFFQYFCNKLGVQLWPQEHLKNVLKFAWINIIDLKFLSVLSKQLGTS